MEPKPNNRLRKTMEDRDQAQILLVEDEEAHAELIKRAFENENNYYLHIVSTINEARHYIESSRPQLVITDFMLPDGKGTELLPLQEESMQFPAILMTSYGNEQIAVDAIKGGAIDYVVKSDITFLDMPHIASRALREWNHIEQKRLAEKKILKSLREKEYLLKEIHHRVKNNLQVISSLLRLQSMHVDDQLSLKLFKESQNRVQSMALVHEKLYQSENFSEIDFADYIKSLAKSLYRAYQTNPNIVNLDIDVEHTAIGIDIAVPCGLVINELVSNSLKHAFPEGWDGEARISIELHPKENQMIELTVKDTGVGLPDNFNIETASSLGVHLIQILVVDQLRGSIELSKKPGTTYVIKFESIHENSSRIKNQDNDNI